MFGTVNADPNNPSDPELQLQYDKAAVQVRGCKAAGVAAL